LVLHSDQFKYLVQTSVRVPTIHIEVFNGFPQSVQLMLALEKKLQSKCISK